MTTRLYGLPEREDTLQLKVTTGGEPYRLFATDQPMHPASNPQPLYGSVPYITALDAKFSASAGWINAAQTWIDIADATHGPNATISAQTATFVSESGVLEFFVFAVPASNQTSVNRVQKT